MNIAFLQRAFSKKIIEATKTTTLGLCKEFVKDKNKAEVITERGYLYGENLEKHETIEGISIHRPYFFPFPIKNCPKIIEILNYFSAPSLGVKYVEDKFNVKFDIIHSISAAPVLALTGVFAKLISRRAKLVHTIKSESPYGFKFAWLLNFADKVIVPSEQVKKNLIKGGCKAHNISLIKSPIDTERFRPMDKNKMKAKYGFKNKKIVLYYGGFIRNKGVDDLFETVRYLVEENPEIELHLINRGNIEKKYLKLYQGLGSYKANVKMFFKKINVPEYLNAVDVLVLPYANLKSTEANPLCLLEGMACKTPIVTTDLPELREIVEPNKDVIMANPGDPKSIASNILKLLNDKKLQTKLSENAHKKVKDFDIKKIAQEHIRLYRSLLRS